MTTAVSENAGSPKARRSSVVLPLPRNPVSSVSGILSKTGAPFIAGSEEQGPKPIAAASFHAGMRAASGGIEAALSKFARDRGAGEAESARPGHSRHDAAVAFRGLRYHHACHNSAAYAAISGGKPHGMTLTVSARSANPASAERALT